MKIKEIAGILEAELFCGEAMLDCEISSVCATDLMSDVIAFLRDGPALVTGLIDNQVIHTADMMDINCVIFVRGKKPGLSVTEQARAKNIAYMTTALSMYASCGKLYSAGLR